MRAFVCFALVRPHMRARVVAGEFPRRTSGTGIVKNAGVRGATSLGNNKYGAAAAMEASIIT